MSPPLDPQSTEQALQLLEKIQAKVLLELWTTLMLVGGMAAIAIGQIVKLFGWSRTSDIFIAIFGYTMTWVPAAIAPWLGWTVIILATANFIKVTIGAPAGGKNPTSS